MYVKYDLSEFGQILAKSDNHPFLKKKKTCEIASVGALSLFFWLTSEYFNKF